MKKRVKILILDVLIVAAVICLGCLGFRLYERFQDLNHTKQVAQKVEKEAGIDPQNKAEIGITRDTYLTLKSLNSDYIGWLKWDSGIISEPIVQGQSNDSYLRRDFYGDYDVFGTVFLDSLAKVGDDNMPIYGHAMTGVYSDTRKFSQLQNMTNQNFYEANMSFSIYWETTVTKYEVVSAFLIDVNSDNWNYMQNCFRNEADKAAWIDQVVSRSEIVAGAELKNEDRFVTFQTCRDGYSGWRYVVVGRETATENLE